MSSVVQNWVFNDGISMKQQCILLTALRSCDGIYNDDVSKTVIRKIRCTLLNNAADANTNFMQTDVPLDIVARFAKSRDKYPVHFYIHVCHCCEVIGYKHPDTDIRQWFYKAYLLMVKALYLNPETEQECDERLCDGRTIIYEDFAKDIIAS